MLHGQTYNMTLQKFRWYFILNVPSAHLKELRSTPEFGDPYIANMRGTQHCIEDNM